MASLTAYKQLTLIEVAKRKAPDNTMATIAEVLSQDNAILQDAVWREANDTFSNKTVRRASLPSGSWRKLNEGVATESSETVELMDVIGMLETWSENDIEIINAFPNPKQARNDEAMAFVEGLGQTMAETMVYGNASTTPETFTGLAVEFVHAQDMRVILRGIRTVSDFEYESQMALTNRQLAPDIETVFVMSDPRYAHLSSQLIREVVARGGNVSAFVPVHVARVLSERLKPT